ncbi:hypothetical protein [Dyadobacter sp.]|uniref:hypothetical protein n=1 Tax=Dyadobacter sp. TaxID=1914288 RepID=UPI003F7237F4
MPGRKSKKRKWKKAAIVVLKWVSAILPVCAFIYILYYYKQFDFLKEKKEAVSKTEVITNSDSAATFSMNAKEELLKKILIQNNEWHSVGGVAIHSMTIVNGTDKKLSSVDVEFKYLSETQSVVTSKIVNIKAAVAPGKSYKASGISAGYVNNSVVGCDTKVANARF